MKFLLLFLVAIGSAGAVEQPQADLNGYTAEYQHPILFEGTGDTLVSGWSGPNAYTIPTPATGSPTCSGASGAASGEYWIRDNAGVSELEQGTLGYSVYWICPGDYRSSVGSTLNLADSGSSAADGGVIKVLCYSSDMTKNPVQRNPDWRDNSNGNPNDPNFDFTEECVLPKLATAGQDYWFFHGVTFNSSSWTSSKTVRIEDGSVGIVLDRTWVACYRQEPSNLNNTSFSCLLFEQTNDSGDNPQSDSWVQNSVVGPCSMIYDADVVGIEGERDSSNNRVINTDVIDCGVTIQTGGNAIDGVGEGLIVENSSLAITDHMRIAEASCGHSAWLATGMRCATNHGCNPGDEASNSSERRIDIGFGGAQRSLMDQAGVCACNQQVHTNKHGSANAANPFLFLNNRVSGAKGENARCMGDAGTRGYGIITQESPLNSLYMNNIIYDSRYMFANATSKWPPGRYTNIRLIQNIFAGFDVDDTAVQFTTPRVYGWSPTYACPSCEFSFNGVAALTAPAYGAGNTMEVGPSGIEVNCNIFRSGVRTDTRTVTGQDNVAIDGADLSGWSGLTGTQTYTLTQAADTSFTFWDRLQSDPVSVTLNAIRSTAESAYLNDCNF